MAAPSSLIILFTYLLLSVCYHPVALLSNESFQRFQSHIYALITHKSQTIYYYAAKELLTLYVVDELTTREIAVLKTTNHMNVQRRLRKLFSLFR